MIWNAQVELAFGCQLRCEFCSINSVDLGRNEYRFMTLDIATQAAAQLGLMKIGRVDFALRGEPLLNESIHKIISIFRVFLPQSRLMVITNGLQIAKSGARFLDDLFESGLNSVLIDAYKPYGINLIETVIKFGLPVQYHTVDQPGFNPWSKYSGQHIIFSKDLRDSSSKRRGIINQGGNSPYFSRIKQPYSKYCPLPWREISIHYNGNVPICCDDWNSQCIFGNIMESNLLALYDSIAFVAAKKLLRYGKRIFPPCNKCNGPSPGRRGFLPKCNEANDTEINSLMSAIVASPGLENSEWWDGEKYANIHTYKK